MREKRAYISISMENGGMKTLIIAVVEPLPVILAGKAGSQTAISPYIMISLPGTYTLNANITTSSNVIFEGADYTINSIDKLDVYAVSVYNSTNALTNVL